MIIELNYMDELFKDKKNSDSDLKLFNWTLMKLLLGKYLKNNI